MSADNLNDIDFEKVSSEMKIVQNNITKFIEGSKGGCKPLEDIWKYKKGTGGGITRVWEGDCYKSEHLKDLNLFNSNDDVDNKKEKFSSEKILLEKGGVNFSSLGGKDLPTSATTKLNIPENSDYKVCGVSLVFHALNPHIPTIHMNIRYFETSSGKNLWWFGGGIDVTPVYINFSDVQKFHLVLKKVFDKHNVDWATYKKKCDEYFFLPHRSECRGVGGVFFDHFGPKTFPNKSRSDHLKFVVDIGNALIDCYKIFVNSGQDKLFSRNQREFQLWRRSRYVEFNLLFDRGTKFGIQSNGRTESILMSLPQICIWKYQFQANKDQQNEKKALLYLKPYDWISFKNEQEWLHSIKKD